MNNNNREAFLESTELCDFDLKPRIREKALEIAQNCSDKQEEFESIFLFVRELPYGLDDWDVPASQVFNQGWGMCSGKTNLLVAMLRSLGIPARYRVYRIKAESSLWSQVSNNETISKEMGSAPAQQDHIDCEVWLERWIACDPSRDTLMEKGIKALGIPLEREPIRNEAGNVDYLILANFDDWARERQAARKFRENRKEIFRWVNNQLWRIRKLAQDNG